MKYLENELSSVKQTLAQQLNKSCTVDDLARAISDQSAIFTQKYNDLSHGYDVLHTRFNITNTRLAEVEENMSNLDQLKGINQLKQLIQYKRKLIRYIQKAYQLFSTNNSGFPSALQQDNHVRKKIPDMGKTIKTVEEELNHTSSSITANVSEQVQNIERRQKITNLDIQEYQRAIRKVLT